ncbi:hypothetical protein Golomagni_01253 [Golovinomyces magnicellulatus]|nr:hypothetical protein Golomagni_01253 [Golovinomyces magnicellulatus]
MVMLESNKEAANQKMRPSSPATPEKENIGKESKSHSSTHQKKISEDESQEYPPSEEELLSLRRVADKIPWKIYTLCFVELCERFSFYGTTVVFTNFLQQELPPNSRTGAGFSGQSGALGLGQKVSTGIGNFNQFWIFLVPLFAAYISDKYLGRFKTVCVALAIAIVGHIVLVISAIPVVIVSSRNSLICFMTGLIIMGLGTGSFKPNISPLIAEQLRITNLSVRVLPSGEKVIIDPAVTQSRVYHYFYLFINIGALVGQIAMVYCEKYVGFWLSFLLPTILLSICPLVLWYASNNYVRVRPEGSVLGNAISLFLLGNKGCWSINPLKTYRRLNDGMFWTRIKPSEIPPSQRPSWMTFDDKWVDEVRRGFAACAVFCWIPLYWLTYNQLNNNLTSQAAVMKLNGLPNDILSNLDPFALIILIPIFDVIIYPLLRKAKINLTPIKKITLGFYTGAAAMVWAAVIQAYIYKKSLCGSNAAGRLPSSLGGDGKKTCPPVSISVWAQSGAYILIAISEILASITTLEYAFSKAPTNMRSLVMAFSLFTAAIAAALGEAFVTLSSDPLLVWNYGTMAVLSAVAGTAFYWQFRELDRNDDRLNSLPVGHLALAVNRME